MKQLPPSGASERDIAFAVRQLIDGRGNSVGTVTLAVSATSTVVNRTNADIGAQVFLFPKTANAAAAMATTYVLAANITRTGFTITHASAATADRTFSYLVIGG